MSDAERRIGTSEREAATAALREHHAQGRLTSQEYEDRSLRAGQARTWAQLEPLFSDLPAPHPPAPPRAGAAMEIRRSGGLLPEPYAAWAMALTPFAAMVLFFTTGFWLWWLAIPVIGLIIYGPDGHHRDRRR